MASNKHPLDNLDFDNLGFDSLDDGGFGNIRDDRKAITKASSAFAKGVRDSFVKPENIRTLAANALPRGYGTAISQTMDATRGANELYNIAIRELRPALPAMRRMTGRMLPHAQRYLPKSVLEQLEKFSSKTEYQGYSQEQADEDTVSNALGDIFKINMEHTERARIEDKTERLIHDKVMDLRSMGQLKLLQGIRDNTERTTAFQDQITHRFYQKSLELQYRSYFVQRDILKLMLNDSDRDKIFLESIMKNTALPEVAKIQATERAGGMLRDKIMMSMGSGASDYARNFFRRTIKNIGDSVRNTSAMASEGIMASDSAADMMEGMGMDQGTFLESIMSGLGGMAGEKAMGLGGAALRKYTSKNPKLAKRGNQMEYFLSNYPALANKWAKSDDGESGNTGFLVRLLKSFVPGFTLDSSLKGSPILGLDKPATFDDRSHRTINEILPGLLSRIHNSLEKIRTGNNDLEPIEYNLDRGLFTDRSVRIKDMKSRILNPHNAMNANDAVDRLMGGAKLGGKLSKETEAAFRKQIILDALSGYDGGLDPKRYGTSSKTSLAMLSQEQRKEIEDALGDHFNDETQGNIVDSSRLMKDVRNRLPDPRSQMLAYQQVGMLPELREMGLAVGDGLNNKIDYEKWVSMFTEASSEAGPTPAGDPERIKRRMAMKRAMVHAKRRTRSAAGKVKGAIKSVYVEGSSAPILDEAKMRAGKYVDAASSKIIETFDDIRSNVVDTDTGETVFTADRMRSALVDNMGQAVKELPLDRIRSFIDRQKSEAERILGSTISGMSPRLAALRQKAMGVAERTRTSFDVFVKGTNRLAISGERLRNGDYRDQLTGNPITNVDDISGPVVDTSGDVVLSAQDAAAGFVDSQGKTLDQISARIARNIQAMRGSLRTKLPGFENTTNSPLGAQEGVAQNDQGDLVRLNSEQVVLLQAIHQTLLAGVAINGGAGGGGGGGPAGYFGKFGQQFKKWFGPGQLIKGGASGVGMAGKGVLNYLKWSYSTMWSGAKAGAGALLGVGGTTKDVLTDVRSKGSTRILLYATKIRNGDYRDAKDPKRVIKAFKDIRGAVIDELGNVVLTPEEYAAGLYDTYGRRITRGVLGLFGAGLKMAGGIANVYASGARFLYDGAATALRMPGKIIKALNEPKDVYVVDDLKTPKLRANLMKSGFYRIRGTRNQLVLTHMDAFKGEVEDREGNLLLSHEDHKKGLCDYRGKPFRSLTGRAVDTVKWAADWAVRGAKGYADLVWGGVGAVKNLAMGVLGIPGRLRGEKRNWMTHSEKVYGVLVAIHDMLDKRMPDDGPTIGSWQDRSAKAKEKAKSKEESAKDAIKEKSSPFAKMMSMFSSMNPFGSDEEDMEDEDDEEGGGNTTVIAGSSGDGSKGKKKGPSKNSRVGRWQRARRAKKLRAQRAAARGGKGGRFSKMRGLKLGVGGLAASLGLAALGDKLPGWAQSGLSWGGNAATAVQGASWLSSLTGGGAAASAATGATAVTAAAGTTAAATGATAATGAATAATAAGTTLGGIAASPVLIPAAIIAAIAGAGYLTYRYHKYGANQAIRRFRMAQYGFDDKEKDYLIPVVKLEEYLQDKVKFDRGQPTLDPKTNWDEILDIFDLDKGVIMDDGTDAERLLFYNWFAYRFKPVYLAHMTALHGLKPNVPLLEVDDKLPAADQVKYLQLTYKIDSNTYNVTASPFKGVKFEPNKGMVEMAYQQAISSAQKKAKGSLSGSRGTQTWATVVAASSPLLRLGGELTGFNKKARGNDKIQDWLKKQGGFIQGLASGLGLMAGEKENTDRKIVGERLAELQSLGGKLSALMAIRFKTYGLIKLDTDRVDALYFLENHVMEDFTYSSSNLAEFNKSSSEYYGKLAAKFGLAIDDDASKQRWVDWFQKRFLPTALAYATAVKSVSPTIDPLKAEKYLSPAQQVIVANATMNAQFTTYLFSKTSVWKYLQSPWDESPLNDSARSCGLNLLALKTMVRNSVYSETIGSVGPKPQPKMVGSSPYFMPAKAPVPYEQTLPKQTSEGTADPMMASGWDAVSTNEQMGWGGGTQVGEQVGSGGMYSQLPIPTRMGKAGLTPLLVAAAKMVGVDANLLATMARIESAYGMNLKAKTSSASGIFQFIAGTWRTMMRKYATKYGIPPDASPFDPRANVLLGALFTRDNLAKVKEIARRAPTFGDAYMMHFLGEGGARKLLTADPNANAAQLMPAAAKANASIFHDNGRARSVAGVIQHLNGLTEAKRESIDGSTGSTLGQAVAATTKSQGGSGGGGGGGSFGAFANQARASTATAQSTSVSMSATPTLANRSASQFQVPSRTSNIYSSAAVSTMTGAVGVGAGLSAQVSSAMAKGVGYGFGSKNSESGSIDCSGWIAEINTKLLRGLLGSAASTAVRLFSGGAADITRNFAKVTGRIYNKQELCSGALKEGMIIGEDHGDKQWDRGRWNGIDHIVQCIRDPKTGMLMITQSQSKKGVTLIPAQQYLNQRAQSKAQLYGVDTYVALDKVTDGKFLAALSGNKPVESYSQPAEPVSAAKPPARISQTASYAGISPPTASAMQSSATLATTRGTSENQRTGVESEKVVKTLEASLDVQKSMLKQLIILVDQTKNNNALSENKTASAQSSETGPKVSGRSMRKIMESSVAERAADAVVSMSRSR